MQKIKVLLFVLLCTFGTPVLAVASTCPTFDAATGNTATSPNPLDVIWQSGHVCNIPGDQVFTDELGTFTFGSNCHMTCAAGWVRSNGVCISAPSGGIGQNFAPGSCTAGTMPTCPPTGEAFFSHPGSCTQFYRCNNGALECRECTAGVNQHWNPAAGKCDTPANAKCPMPFTRNCTATGASLATQTCFQGTAATHCTRCTPVTCSSGWHMNNINSSAENFFNNAQSGLTRCQRCPPWQWLSTAGVCFSPDVTEDGNDLCGVPNSYGVKMCNHQTGVCTPCVWECRDGHMKSGNTCRARDPASGPGVNYFAPCPMRNGTGHKLCSSNSSNCGACNVTSCDAGFFQSGNSCHATETWKTSCAPAPHTGGIQACNAAGTTCGNCFAFDCGGGQVQSTTGECFAPTQNQACTPPSPGNATGNQQCNANGTLCTACTFTGCAPGFNLENGECMLPCPSGAVTLNCSLSTEYSIFARHPNDCRFFSYCEDGKSQCRQCPAGLHWNQEIETCDWAGNVNCCDVWANPYCYIPGS